MATKKRKREIQVLNENSLNEEHLMGIDKRRRLERGRSNKRIKEILMEMTPKKRLTRSNSRSLSRTLRPLKPSPPLSTQHRYSDTVKLRTLGGTLRGTLRAKLAVQLQKNVMKGQQDYSLPRAAVTSQLQYQFMTALERDLKGHKENPSRREQELQGEIDHEMLMRGGTVKLLLASQQPKLMVEAAKNLLASNARVVACTAELQRRKTDQVLNDFSREDDTSGLAKVCLSNIRIPLMWKDTDHFKNKGDHRRYAVFCLVRIGTEIQDTTLLKDVDRTMTDLTFDDVLIFDSVKADFECHLEVYGHKLGTDLSIASTPQKIRNHFNAFSNTIGRSVGKRLSGLICSAEYNLDIWEAFSTKMHCCLQPVTHSFTWMNRSSVDTTNLLTKTDSDITANMLIGPKFKIIAEAKMRLPEVKDAISTYDLTLKSANNSDENGDGGSQSELPLFGHFCCRLAAQPRCLLTDLDIGYLQVKTTPNDESQHLWCQLRNKELSCWSEQPTDASVSPSVSIPLTKDTCILGCDDDSCTVTQLHGMSPVILTSCNGQDKDKWMMSLRRHIHDQELWKQASDRLMTFPPSTPQAKRGSVSNSSTLDCDSPMTRILNRLNVNNKMKERKTRQSY